MAKNDFSFKDLAKDLRQIASNAYDMMDDTIFSYSFAIGSTLCYRTPKDTGRAVYNWITQIDSSSTKTRGVPSDKLTGLYYSIEDMFSELQNFNSRNNSMVTITNNLDYIYKLAYENWAKRPKTTPHAPPNWMIEDNIRDTDFSNYVGDLFKGIKK